jgi:hypothetical protein
VPPDLAVAAVSMACTVRERGDEMLRREGMAKAFERLHNLLYNESSVYEEQKLVSCIAMSIVYIIEIWHRWLIERRQFMRWHIEAVGLDR